MSKCICGKELGLGDKVMIRCKDCEKQISDLEAKLAESEERFKEMEHRFILQYDIRSMYESSYLDLVKRFQALKEQCEKRGKQIVVKSGGKAKKFNEDNAYKLRVELAGADEIIQELKQQVVEKDKQIYVYANEIAFLDRKINQDKISFAIEQLEKARDAVKNVHIEDTQYDCYNFQETTRDDCVAIIDNQLEELQKEMK